MFKKLLSIGALTLLTGVAVFSQNAPGDVSDLVGARASSGESDLRSRGYRFVKTQKGDDRSYSNWWKSNTKTCLSVVTFDGRFDSIVKVTELDCNQSYTGGNGGGYGGGYNNQTNTPPSWAQGTWYSNTGITLTIDRSGSVSAVNGGQTYSGRYYQNKIFLNNDESTISRNGSGIRTYNKNTGEYTNYTRNYNGGSGSGWGNNNGQMSTPPSWAQGTWYSNTGITLTINNRGSVSAVNGGQTYYGRYYQNNIFLNNDESTVSRNGSGIRTYNKNTGEYTNYTRNYNAGSGSGWGNNNGQTSTPPSWAQGTWYSNTGITLTIDRNGSVSAVNGGQTYSGRFYQNKIFLNNDESTVSRDGAGIRTYNKNNGQTTNYTRNYNNGGNNGGGWGGGNRVEVNDLIGAKASSGESDLRARGFRNTRGYKSSGRSFTIWFNSNANQCIRVTTADGRYSEIIATSDYSCR